MSKCAVVDTDAALLRAIWRRQAQAIHDLLEPGKTVTAAQLSVARAFLSDNAVHMHTVNVESPREAIGRLLVDMPEFTDTDGSYGGP